MIRLKPLPPIALTNLQPAFYDVESVTAIEMVSKLYAYLQNMVNDYNAFVTEVNEEIENFENDTNRNIDCFTSCIKQLMLNYIESIDMKIALQDDKIQDAIDNQNEVIANAVQYMKDHIIETATSVVNDAIDEGKILVAITYDEPTEALNIIVNREDDEHGI